MRAKIIVIFLSLVLLKSLIWLFLVPIFQIPDEPSHFSIVEFVAEHGRRPHPRREWVTPSEVIEAAKIVNFNWQINHPMWHGYDAGWLSRLNALAPELKQQITENPWQTSLKRPPLYYYLAAPFYWLGGDTFLGRFFTVRFLSVIFHLLTVWLAYLTAKKIFKSFLLGLTVVVLVAFQPMLSFLSVGVHYDPLAILLATLFTYWVIVKRLWLSLLAALAGVLVKPDLIFLPLFWLWLKFTGKQRWQFGLITLSLLLILAWVAGPLSAAIVAGTVGRYDRWLYVTNLNEYSSLAQFFLSSLISGQLFVQLKNYFLTTAAIHWAQIFPWYWGTFGWLEVTLPAWIFTFLKLLLLVSLTGWVKWWLKGREGHWGWLWGFLLLQAGVILANDFKVFITSGEIYGIQGRYFFPAILVQMIILVLGLKQWFGEKFLASVLIGLGLFLNLIGLLTVYQYFGNVWW